MRTAEGEEIDVQQRAPFRSAPMTGLVLHSAASATTK